jgi:hypothetical protein
MKKVTRRGFFVLLGSGGTALLVYWLRGRRTTTIAAQLPNVLAHNAHTEMIGQHYLRRVPEEADPDLLSELILSDLPWNASIETNLRALIRERVGRDFAEDRVVRLGQWMLSQTEGRLCALALLVNRTEPVG